MKHKRDSNPIMIGQRPSYAEDGTKLSTGNSVALWLNRVQLTLHRSRKDAHAGRRPVRDTYGMGWMARFDWAVRS